MTTDVQEINWKGQARLWLNLAVLQTKTIKTLILELESAQHRFSPDVSVQLKNLLTQADEIMPRLKEPGPSELKINSVADLFQKLTQK